MKRLLRREGWLICCLAAFFLVLPLGAAYPQSEPGTLRLIGKKYADIDYGPSMTLTVQVSEGNIAYKGICIRLDPGPGGVSSGGEFMVFDTDTLRYAGGWRGQGFIDWKNIALDGKHNVHPSIVGELVFENGVAPGWGHPADGRFTDERVLGRDGLRYGPLARDWGHWKGEYVHNDRVVLSYTLGEAEVLESPSAEGPRARRFMTRTLNIGPRTQDLILQVVRGERADFVEHPVPLAASSNRSGVRLGSPVAAVSEGLDDTLFRGATQLEIEDSGDFMRGDFTIYARVKTEEGGALFSKAPKKGPWAPDAQSLFVRDERLVFDIGWVGAVTSKERVADGAWHDVAVTFDASDGDVQLFVDGVPSASKRMQPKSSPGAQVARIGHCAPNFPDPSFFTGEIAEVGYYERALGAGDVARLARRSGVPDGLVAKWRVDARQGDTVPDDAGGAHAARVSGSVTGPAQLDTFVAVDDGGAGTSWVHTAEDGLRLRIPEGGEPIKLKIFLAGVEAGEDTAPFEEVLRTSEAPEDLHPLTLGGPAHWPEKLVTRGTLGQGDGAYVIDDITEPSDNPYRSWLRFSGFDFFEDDTRLAISTWNGDVWLVSGIGESLESLTWQRIASGMFQPLGLKTVDGGIYVLCRDQITLLRDLNGDGETDFYQNFNNDAQVTEHFHEFALDLQLGVDGDFYYTKGARHAADAITPNHGTLIRVSRDGTSSEIIARGFRAPNGLGAGPGGEFIINDNQGHWTPANRINWVVPGGFYGYMQAYHERQVSDGFDPPLCWVHPNTDRSPGTVVWVPDFRWGPLQGHMITVSYGMGQIFHILHEEIDGVHQGGVVRFPLEFETGVMRAKFRPRDGQLYLAGLFGWSSNKTRSGGFYRVRYTGKRLYMPEELHIAEDGVALTFTDPLDPESATDLGNYSISHWNYAWTANYGSPDLKMDGSEGRDTLHADWAALSADGKTVYLRISGIRKVMQMEILLNLKAADGMPVQHNIQNTIHKLGAKTVSQLSGQRISAASQDQHVDPGALASGLIQTIESENGMDTRESRLAALYVAEGRPASPFAAPGQFTSTWTGFLRAELNESYAFSVEGNGSASLSVNGATALGGGEVQLRQGINPITLTYTPPPSGDAELRLYWESERMPSAPVPAAAFARPESTPALDAGLRLRRARLLVAEYRCLRCHGGGREDVEGSMPELRAEGPALDAVAEKYSAAWLRAWLLNPRASRPGTVMPLALDSHDQGVAVQQAADIVGYLGSIAGNVAAPARAKGDIESGAALYGELGCMACHRFSSEERILENDTRLVFPDLDQKWKAGALARYLEAPERDYPTTAMPNFGLSPEEAQALAAHLRAQSGIDGRDEARAPIADPGRGQFLVETLGCLNCHTLLGHASRLTLKALQKGELDSGCLADTRDARKDAPVFNLSGQAREELRGFLRNGGLESVYRDTPAEFAERQIVSLDCLACHARDGIGDRWSLLTDAAAAESPADVNDFFDTASDTIHVGRPPLSFAGEKLHSGWMTQLLAGSLPYKTRPGLAARMPAFPGFAQGLAEGIAAQHGFPPGAASDAPVNRALAAAGRELALREDAFRCNACHGVGDQLPLAGADTETINFAHIPERLRRSYFDRFVLDPQAVLPGTQMPKYVDETGKSTVGSILDGNVPKQFNALWEFMRSLAGSHPKTAK